MLPLAQLTATTTKSVPTVVTPAATNPSGQSLESTTQAGTQASTQVATSQKSSGGFFSSGIGSFLPIALMFVVLYFVLFRGQRKDEKKRKAMISEMKKGDRVMTIGGLVARVVSIDGDEVVLKIDESANVKATYTKSSIQRVLGNDEKK